MANQSKVLLSDHLKAILYNVLLGSRKNRAVAFSIVANIGFLLYMRNSRSSSDNLRLTERKKKKVHSVMIAVGRQGKRRRYVLPANQVSRQHSYSWLEVH